MGECCEKLWEWRDRVIDTPGRVVILFALSRDRVYLSYASILSLKLAFTFTIGLHPHL